jgi:hypothetical protein
MIRRFFTGRDAAPATSSNAGPGSRRDRRRRPALEVLEGRALLSFLGSEQRVSLNPQPTDNGGSDTASSSNGTSVAVWVNAFSPSDHDIWAQRFDGSGRAIGGPISVDFTTADSIVPRVAVDSQGRFVVTWEDINADGTTSVMMRYFDASGTPLTGITPVTPAGSADSTPDVAASDDSLVITWTHQFSSTDDDILAERFAITGGVPQAQGIFAVNTDANVEDAPSVAMSPDGQFDIAYERQFSGADWDIFASQYDANGNLRRSNIPINTDSNPEFNPSVAMDAAGNAVVAYSLVTNGDFGIYANRLSSGGVVGGLIRVQDTVGVDEFGASVALAPTDGRFVVAYDTSNGVQITEMGSNDTAVTTFGPVVGFSPTVSIDGTDRYLATFTRFDSSANHEDIFSLRDSLS